MTDKICTSQEELAAAIAAQKAGDTSRIIIDSPAGVWLTIGGEADVSGVQGESCIGDVSDSATVRDVRDSATVRDVRGSATVSYVSDSATVRDVSGSAHIALHGRASATDVGPHVAVRFLEVVAPVESLRPIDASKAKVERLTVLREVTVEGRPIEEARS